MPGGDHGLQKGSGLDTIHRLHGPVFLGSLAAEVKGNGDIPMHKLVRKATAGSKAIKRNVNNDLIPRQLREPLRQPLTVRHRSASVLRGEDDLETVGEPPLNSPSLLVTEDFQS